MRHLFYRPIYGTVSRAYNGMFTCEYFRLRWELWVGVNWSVVRETLNHVNNLWHNKEAWYSFFTFSPLSNVLRNSTNIQKFTFVFSFWWKINFQKQFIVFYKLRTEEQFYPSEVNEAISNRANGFPRPFLWKAANIGLACKVWLMSLCLCPFLSKTDKVILPA